MLLQMIIFPQNYPKNDPQNPKLLKFIAGRGTASLRYRKKPKYQSRRAPPKPKITPWVSETGFLNQIFGFDAKIVAETRFLGVGWGFRLDSREGGNDINTWCWE